MSHFLRRLSHHTEQKLVDLDAGSVVAELVIPAVDSSTRRKGLLGRDSLAEGLAMLIAPCTAIHTFGMRFAIDVLFVARDGRLLKIVEGLQPWRIAVAWGAFATVELAAGSAKRCRLAAGDRLALRARQVERLASA